MAENKTLHIEFDEEKGRMSCECHASIDDLVTMTGYLLRQQFIMTAKEMAESRGAVITDTQWKQMLYQVAKQHSEKIARIIEFGEVE